MTKRVHAAALGSLSSFAPDPYGELTHFGRSFGGPGDMEKSCPCVKASCGLVTSTGIVKRCEQHNPVYTQTIRIAHKAHECPDRQTATSVPDERLMPGVFLSRTEMGLVLDIMMAVVAEEKVMLSRPAVEVLRKMAVHAGSDPMGWTPLVYRCEYEHEWSPTPTRSPDCQVCRQPFAGSRFHKSSVRFI